MALMPSTTLASPDIMMFAGSTVTLVFSSVAPAP